MLPFQLMRRSATIINLYRLTAKNHSFGYKIVHFDKLTA